MNPKLTDLILGPNSEDKCRLVVRLTTSFWKDKRGLHMKRSLNFQHRKSSGHNFLSEDADCVGADETIARIINFPKEDGLYLVTTCNEKYDRETGLIDDYDFQLLKLVD